MEQTKPAVKSSINWTAIAGAAASISGIVAVNDVDVSAVLETAKTVVPIQWLPWFTLGTSIVTFLLRTFRKNKPIAGVVTQQ